MTPKRASRHRERLEFWAKRALEQLNPKGLPTREVFLTRASNAFQMFVVAALLVGSSGAAGQPPSEVPELGESPFRTDLVENRAYRFCLDPRGLAVRNLAWGAPIDVSWEFDVRSKENPHEYLRVLIHDPSLSAIASKEKLRTAWSLDTMTQAMELWNRNNSIEGLAIGTAFEEQLREFELSEIEPVDLNGLLGYRFSVAGLGRYGEGGIVRFPKAGTTFYFLALPGGLTLHARVPSNDEQLLTALQTLRPGECLEGPS